MASEVKVTVPRLALIEAIEAREKALQESTASVLSLEVEEFIATMHRTENLLRAGAIETETNYYPSDTYADDPDRSFLLGPLMDAYNEAVEANRKNPQNRAKLLDRCAKQLRLLRLSNDETIEIGIEDELYDLL